MNIRVALLLWLLNFGSAQDANCDFYQKVAVGVRYSITSPGYPNSYSGGKQCRWIAECPSGYNCRVDCTVNMPQTQACYLDKLMISLSGDPTLVGAETYCGRGTLTKVSTGTKITIGLSTDRYTTGGNFQCELTAQAVPPTQQCTCGLRKQNRIVGGQETRVNEYPMMAGLYEVAKELITCGAVIISDKYVLTAAHCVENKSLNTYQVAVGVHDVEAVNQYTQLLIVQYIKIHPLYNNNNYDYDIALVGVYGTIQFNAGVGPVCLPFKYVNTNFTGSKVTVLGWGTQEPGGPTSNVLRKVDLDVISQPSCRSKVPELTDRQMCTLTPGKDSCQDDSGGPVLLTDSTSGRLFSIGIISQGRFCASATDPGISTRVTAFLDWIINNAPYNYCVK